jgi:hypothetical protein
VQLFPIELPIILGLDHSHPLCLRVWMRVRTSDITWYLVDGDLLNADTIKLRVYGIDDNFGGRGKFVHEGTYKLNDQEREKAYDLIAAQATKIAKQTIEDEDEAYLRARVKAKRLELFDI